MSLLDKASQERENRFARASRSDHSKLGKSSVENKVESNLNIDEKPLKKIVSLEKSLQANIDSIDAYVSSNSVEAIKIKIILSYVALLSIPLTNIIGLVFFLISSFISKSLPKDNTSAINDIKMEYKKMRSIAKGFVFIILLCLGVIGLIIYFEGIEGDQSVIEGAIVFSTFVFVIVYSIYLYIRGLFNFIQLMQTYKKK